MRPSSYLSTILFLAWIPAACGESGSKTADVVQAATRSAAEVGRELGEMAARLAEMAPEEAKTRLRELVDAAARELEAVKDSETAQKIAAELQRLLDQLVALAKKLGEKLDLAAIQQSATELAERFKNDPRVQGALRNLREKLDSLGG
jgi:sugar-specific transcriptional regulator TrmB